MNSPWPPTFEPLKRLSRGHQQTLAAYCPWTWQRADQTRQHRVTLADGDRIVLHDDCPSGWQPGHRVALLVPGLGGSHKTPYLVRSAAKLNRRGTRTFRMDQRGFGSAAKLARWPHHAGRSDDVAASGSQPYQTISGRFESLASCSRPTKASAISQRSLSGRRCNADANASRTEADGS